MKFYLVFLCIIVSCNKLASEPLTIVENGKVRAELIYASHEPHAKKAAQEIQEYIKKISGVEKSLKKCGGKGEISKINKI